MSKKLCIKIKNQKQADFVTKVFEKLGYSLWDCACSYDEECEWFFLDTTNKNYLFDTGTLPDDYKECHSYKNFVVEFLKQHYCILKNPEQKTNLQKKLEDLGICEKKEIAYGNMIFPLFRYSSTFAGFKFFCSSIEVGGLVQISYDQLNSLLDSIEEYDKLSGDMKNGQKLTVENTCFYIDNKFELAAAKAYLKFFLEENNLENGLVKTAFDGVSIRTHKFFYLDSGGDIEAWSANRNACDIVTYQKYAELIKEKFAKKSFIFSNGLEAQVLNDGRIKIGCKTFDKSFWKNCCEMLLVLGTTGLEIEDEVFNEIDIRRFEDFLKQTNSK